MTLEVTADLGDVDRPRALRRSLCRRGRREAGHRIGLTDPRDQLLDQFGRECVVAFQRRVDPLDLLDPLAVRVLEPAFQLRLAGLEPGNLRPEV
ncbi:hypothetical protein [Sphingobium algorifonticola]|uniref:Uncharacterized protein n=1 Tax=Sphingobium algorifonticola TaxID=2008318 RepID=A0A437J9M7_9SPHN|nr:hypothetical protein [Sphingobium algorifonticola]RVT42012.1 hypothetical protein ENE74_07135 [Sphingobium algorifonticola]